MIPILSIITINYNNASGLRKTIESVARQTFKNFEYIVIDGGSTDGSAEVIKEYTDKITYWVSEPDKGIYCAMNKGILKAKGKYLQFLNSGDWLINDAVLNNVFSQKHTADILYGDYFMVFNHNNMKLISFKNKILNLKFLYEDSLGHPSSYIKKMLFDDEMYDENLTIISDWKFFFKKIILESCTTEYIDMPIVNFDTTGISLNEQNMALIAQEKNQVFIEYIPDFVLRDIKEFYSLKKNILIQLIIETKKHKGLSSLLFGFIWIVKKGYQKICTLLLILRFRLNR